MSGLRGLGIAVIFIIVLLFFTGCSSPGVLKSRSDHIDQDQDREFIKWYDEQTNLVIAEFKQIRIALDRGNIEDASVWAGQMKSDTEALIEQCDKFKVSDELLTAQKKYKAFLISMNRVAAKILESFETKNSGSFDTALEQLQIAFEQLNTTKSYIKEYCDSHGC